MRDDEIDESLAALGKRTESIRPRANFTAIVMSALANETKTAPDLWTDLPRAFRKLLPVFALSAAVAIGFGIHASNAFDDALVHYDETEIDW